MLLVVAVRYIPAVDHSAVEWVVCFEALEFLEVAADASLEVVHSYLQTRQLRGISKLSMKVKI